VANLIIVATEGQSIPGLSRQPFTYGDGAVEEALGTDIIAATGSLVPGERVLVITPKGGAIWASVVQMGREILVTA
jgi:hypothetical protein